MPRSTPWCVPRPMHTLWTAFAVIVIASSAARLFAGDEWPPEIERAWLIKEAKILGDENGDAAAEGNLLLLIGQRLYLALDQNTANDHDFSELPVLLEKGFVIDEVTQTKDTTVAYARHKEGKRKLTLTPSTDDRYVLRITFAEKVENDYKMQMVLQSVDRKSAQQRLRKILAIGELQGNIQMRSLNDWLASE